jgi:uncharacterized membrane protein YdjX (TVP38/TMEM64 family)
LVSIGFTPNFITIRKGYNQTPESFRDLVLSLGLMGAVIYTAIFIVRPLFLNPSIALFMVGGLAFGPVVGSVYTSVGAPLSGTVGFWFSRKMGTGVLNNTQFSFPVVFLLILILVMSVTVINYGACLSHMSFVIILAPTLWE